jgi:predicted DNA-binding transcriptional regulator AlpA
MERRTVSIPEFARAVGISPSSAYSRAKRDALPVPVIKIGRRYVVSREALDRLLRGERLSVQALP